MQIHLGEECSRQRKQRVRVPGLQVGGSLMHETEQQKGQEGWGAVMEGRTWDEVRELMGSDQGELCRSL